jgi:chitodextrinase
MNMTDVSADLSWTAQSGVSGYEYVVDQNASAPASGTSTTATSVNQTGLSASTVYYLHVRTDCGSANFSPWTTISFTTTATPCAAPTGLAAANMTDVSADLSWTAQSGVSGYEYVVDQNASAPASGTSTTATSVNQTGLSASTVYYLHVRTDCGSGNFSTWTTISFTTTQTPPPCPAPAGLSVINITNTSATLGWTFQAGAIGYQYVVDQSSADPASGGGTNTSTNTGSVSGLSSGTVYYAHIRTDCGNGNFSDWTTVQFTTQTIGLEELSGQLFFVYPNPATDLVTIETNGEASITLINANGQALYTFEITDKATIPVSDLEAGIYFLQLVQNGTRAIQKVTIQ